MYTIKQYRPAFVTGFKDETVSFNSIEEFLEIDFVKNFTGITKYEGYTSEGFFVTPDIEYIFHIGYNPEEDKLQQYCVSEVIGGDINRLRTMFSKKWNLKSL
jgi:hypothetical protein